jgi:predicted esterase
MKLSQSFLFAGMMVLSAAVVAGPPMTGPPAPQLKARPSPTAPALAPGETSLVNGAVAYRPASAPAGPLARLVLRHGAGGYPPGFLQKMEPVADRLGLILVAPHSSDRTWDLIENMQMGDEPWHGPDARRMDQSLADLFGRAAVDPSHVVLLGFSDGASYALSLGLSNPKLFTSVVALSPGMMAPQSRVDRQQRIFIAHGRSDTVLPFAGTKDIADGLVRAGDNVRFRSFDGGHQIDPASLTEALEWAFDRSGLQP